MLVVTGGDCGIIGSGSPVNTLRMDGGSIRPIDLIVTSLISGISH
jgi:hypothetical protein